VESPKEHQPSWRERLYPERLPNEEFALWLGTPIAVVLFVLAAMYFNRPGGSADGVLILGCSLFFIARTNQRQHAKLNARIEELEAELKTAPVQAPNTSPAEM
jgi:hypothetical protein